MTFEEVYGLGIFCVIVIVCAGILLFIRRQKKLLVKDYDERQKLIQGKGYQYGFFATVISCLLYGAGISSAAIPVHPTVGIVACVFVGIGVFVGYCIWKDAYFGIHQDHKGMILLMLLCVVVNALATVTHIMEGNLLEDGVLGIEALNLLCALLFGALLIVVFLKKYRFGKQEREEVDSDR